MADGNETKQHEYAPYTAELIAVAEAAIQLQKDNGPCDGTDDDYDPEDPYCQDEACAYCALCRASEALVRAYAYS